MDSKQMKVELTGACMAAIINHIRTTRGANAFGVNASVTEPQPNRLQVRCGDGRYFEVVIKEAY